MLTKTRDSWITARVPVSMRKEFHDKATRYGKPSEVLRELIEAFIDDRLTIKPPVTRNSLERLYSHD